MLITILRSPIGGGVNMQRESLRARERERERERERDSQTGDVECEMFLASGRAGQVTAVDAGIALVRAPDDEHRQRAVVRTCPVILAPVLTPPKGTGLGLGLELLYANASLLSRPHNCAL